MKRADSSAGRNYGESVYESIRSDIISGALPAGTRLTELKLADQYSVSRTPVREALQRLEAHGYARADGKTVLVTAPSEDDVVDAYVLRETLEGLASSLAAARCTEADRIRLKVLMNNFTEAEEQLDYERAVTTTLAFHEVVWRMSGSAVLQKVMRDLIETFWVRVTPSTIKNPDRLRASAADHRALAQAIMDGDQQLAEQIAKDHIRYARDARIAANLG